MKHTPYSTRLFVSRNGICLDRIASFSIQDKLFVCAVNYTRLIFWLKKGIRVNTFIFPQKAHQFFNLNNLFKIVKKKE